MTLTKKYRQTLLPKKRVWIIYFSAAFGRESQVDSDFWESIRDKTSYSLNLDDIYK